MSDANNQKTVEDQMKKSIASDRARVQLGKISKFGLMEMSRQRLRPSLSEHTKILCPRCHGTGKIRTIASISLAVMRKIEETVLNKNLAAIQVFAPVDLAAFLTNERRKELLELEKRNKLKIIIIPDQYIDTPDFEIKEINRNDHNYNLKEPSYSLIPEPPIPDLNNEEQEQIEEPVVHFSYSTPKHNKELDNKNGLLKKVWSYFLKNNSSTTNITSDKKYSHKNHRDSSHNSKHQKKKTDKSKYKYKEYHEHNLKNESLDHNPLANDAVIENQNKDKLPPGKQSHSHKKRSAS